VEVIEAIGLALNLMGQLKRHTKIGAICHAILGRLIAKLCLSPEDNLVMHTSSSLDSGKQLGTSEPQTNANSSSPDETSTGSSESTFEASPAIPESSPALDWTVPSMDATQDRDLIDLTDIDLSELDQIWDWASLDFNFDLMN
jgi:hypothetical protein